MSYDLEVATREAPLPTEIEEWAVTKNLDVRPDSDARHFAIHDPRSRGDGFLMDVDGPFEAEPEDFSEDLVGACLAPRWMTTIQVPYSVPKRGIALGRSLARHLAESKAGAAFDQQEGTLIWPRGRAKRVSPRQEARTTSRVKVEWFLPASAEHVAPPTLVALLRKFCPEALPTRYGQWEPLPHRFDPDDPTPFVTFLRENDDGNAFWFASRPSFGGYFTAPRAAKYAKPDEEHLRITHVEVDFDNLVLEEEPRWREAVVDLFAEGASSLGAFYGAIQIEPGWTVSRNNRLWSTAAGLLQGAEHIRRGVLWQGLPPVPVWVSWFGSPYRDLVRDHLLREIDGLGASKPSVLTRLAGGRRRPTLARAEIKEREAGLLMRLGERGAPRAELPWVSLPRELIYEYRPPLDNADGSVSSNPAQPEDAAGVIPRLDE